VGVESGAKIRLRDKGHVSTNGGPPGDLILLLKVSEHPHYRRISKNLEMKLPVSLAEAALGAKIDVPTPYGTVAMSIPAGSSSGRRLRLKGQGVKSDDGTAGDLIVEIQIRLPTTIDDASKKLIEQFNLANPVHLREDLAF
jgi:DnaJ-class molecular chaperone